MKQACIRFYAQLAASAAVTSGPNGIPALMMRCGSTSPFADLLLHCSARQNPHADSSFECVPQRGSGVALGRPQNQNCYCAEGPLPSWNRPDSGLMRGVRRSSIAQPDVRPEARDPSPNLLLGSVGTGRTPTPIASSVKKPSTTRSSSTAAADSQLSHSQTQRALDRAAAGPETASSIRRRRSRP